MYVQAMLGAYGYGIEAFLKIMEREFH